MFVLLIVICKECLGLFIFGMEIWFLLDEKLYFMIFVRIVVLCFMVDL